VVGDEAPDGDYGHVCLAVFSGFPHLGGGRCGGVECFVPLGVLEVELAPGGRDCCKACAFGVCGLRAARGAGGLRGA